MSGNGAKTHKQQFAERAGIREEDVIDGGSSAPVKDKPVPEGSNEQGDLLKRLKKSESSNTLGVK